MSDRLSRIFQIYIQDGYDYSSVRMMLLGSPEIPKNEHIRVPAAIWTKICEILPTAYADNATKELLEPVLPQPTPLPKK